MNKTTIISLLVLVGATLMLTATVTAQDETVSNVNGGELSETNVETTSDAGTWTGFYGDLTGTVELGDGTNNFFEWTVEDPSGSVIYAVPGSNTNDPSSANLAEVNEGDADTVTGTSGTEAASNTYVDGNGDFQTLATPNVGNVEDLGETAGVDTISDAGSFTSFLAEDQDVAENPVFFTETLNQQDGFNDGNYDYQLLATAGDDFSDETFDFYVELS